MHTIRPRPIAVSAFLLIVLVLTQLACGLSASRQTQTAMPPTRVTAKATAAPTRTARPTATQEQQSGASQPTDTPPPTRAPTQAPASTATQEQQSGGESTQAAQPTSTPTQEGSGAEGSGGAMQAAGGLQVVGQGFGQEGQELGYAILVENPDRQNAIESSQVSVAVYDASGAEVGTDSNYIELILPGQKIGVGGTLYLDEGITVTQMKVQLDAGEAAVTDLGEPFTSEQVAYQPGSYYSSVLGLVANPYDQDMYDLRVSAVLYDSAGKIIGGGFTYLNFVLGKNKTGVSVSVASAGEVARAELYSVVSGLTGLSSSEMPSGAQPISVQKQGFGQEDTQVGYGALVQNPNTHFALENGLYHVNLYGADGSLIDVEEGYLFVLLPGQTLGVSGILYLDEGQQAASMDFQVASGQYQSFDPIDLFTAENVAYQADTFFPKVTGEIVNPYTADATSVMVSAVVYNDAGEIIGGGFTYLDSIPAGGKASVEVGVTVNGTPARSELYAGLISLSDYKP